jgi:hypothetical protein
MGTLRRGGLQRGPPDNRAFSVGRHSNYDPRNEKSEQLKRSNISLFILIAVALRGATQGAVSRKSNPDQTRAAGKHTDNLSLRPSL